MPICIEISPFVFEVQRSQIGNRRTDERTDKRTGREQMPPASLDWRMDRNYMFTDGIVFVIFTMVSAFCLRQLSFLFISLGKGKYRVKWERGEVWEECGGKGKVWRSGKLECMKK